MYGSNYDTKIWVWDEDLQLIACNDDYYSDYTSRMDDVPLDAGMTYYLVIDGYGGDAGDYVLEVVRSGPCVVYCSPSAELEGEPPLIAGYVDAFNGGCTSPEFGTPFGTITQDVFCGVTGYYDYSRDTDWFELVVPAGGVVEIMGDAEQATHMYEIGPRDCDEVAVVQDVIIGPCTEETITIAGEPGSTIWFWVGPITYGQGWVVEYDYTLYTNLIVAVEHHTFSEVKALFE